MGISGGGILVSLDHALRRAAHAASRAPIIGGPLRLASIAARPLRRRIIGPRLDAEAERLSASLAAHWPAPPEGRGPLHVGLLCMLWHDRTSGIAVWTRVLAEALVREGHRVTVIVVADREEAEGVEGGVRVLVVPAAPLRRWPKLPPLPPFLADRVRGAFAAVLAIHAEDPFDIVSGPIWQVEPLALVSAGAMPVAVSLHTTQAMLSAVGIAENDEARALIAAERALLESAPIVVTNTRAAARDIALASRVRIAPERLHVVPHGLPDHGPGAAMAGEGRGPRLLFLGRLDHRKGIDTLLAALPEVLSETPAAAEASIDIAGPPHGESPEPAFRGRHADAPWLGRVRFLGRVSDAGKEELLAGADIVVLPARYESFGLVAVEAMMFGKPVISTLAGGIPEVVEDGVTGLLVPPDDPAALAGAMRRLIVDGGLRARMGKAGRERYLARFTDRAMARAWLAAVREARAPRLAAQ